ncbi:uncharacterized protein LOC129302779 [Prosopis cineraria]|uniref:uncharacterized protein LOC129302779 n=1 Tax=Prosopis cineraria TaxID=364024 RepID=UPI0024100AAA|nr:uncharacterized protein LOC129302779 [Prosopis cineraria]
MSNKQIKRLPDCPNRRPLRSLSPSLKSVLASLKSLTSSGNEDIDAGKGFLSCRNYKIVTQMPSLATQPNQKGLVPLHMASVAERVEIVKELLKAKLDDEVNQCLLKDDDGWTPLHYAVFRGRVDVIEELISHCPEYLQELTATGETVLHLAARANRFEAFKLTVEKINRLPNSQILLGAKDHYGKTMHDLVAAKKRFQAILEREKNDHHMQEEETRLNVEVKGGEHEAPKNEKKEAGGNKKYEKSILVVATLIITLTYQGLLNPPSTFFKKGSEIDWSCILQAVIDTDHRQPDVVSNLNQCPAFLAFCFLVMNTLIFLVCIVLLDLSLRGHRGFLFLLRLLTLFLTFSYCGLLAAFSYYAVYVSIPLAIFSFVYFITVIFSEPWLRAMIWRILRNPRQCGPEFNKCFKY